VAVAEEATATSEGVLGELAGEFVFADSAQQDSKIAGRGQGVGVVVAEQATAPGEGVLKKLASLLVLPEMVLQYREIVSCLQHLIIIRF
jgi:hypothetical protein